MAGGYDEDDPYSIELASRSVPVAAPVFGALDSQGDYFLGDGYARAAYEHGVAQLQALGYATVTIDYAPFKEISDMTYFGPSMSERTAVLGEFISTHSNATYTAVVRDAIVKAADFSAVDAFTMLHRLKALERQTERETWSHVDFLCIPAAPTIHTRGAVNRDPGWGSTSLRAYTNFAPFLGLPAISVPNGFRQDGLPTGIMFVGKRTDDVALLHLAESFAA